MAHNLALRLIITEPMIDKIYEDVISESGDYGRGWWTHPFFDERYKGRLVGFGDKVYIYFPTESDKVMFLLKFGVK